MGVNCYNRTYSFESKFTIELDRKNCKATAKVKIRLQSDVDDTVKAGWKTAVENKWSDKYKMCTSCCRCKDGVTIFVAIEYVAMGEHQVVFPQEATTDMTAWGTRDSGSGVAHEVGHMLGNRDEYYTVDGVRYGDGADNVMGTSTKDPKVAHYELIADSLDESSTVVAKSESCP